MEPLKTILFFALSCFLIPGCAYIEYVGEWPQEDKGYVIPSEFPPTRGTPVYITLQPQKDYYYEGEEITGAFYNDEFEGYYLVSPNGCSGTSRLQKWSGQSWITIHTAPRNMACLQVVRYYPLEWGVILQYRFPEARMADLGLEISGIYRFAVSISDKATNHFTFYSPEFTIYKRTFGRSNLH